MLFYDRGRVPQGMYRRVEAPPEKKQNSPPPPRSTRECTNYRPTGGVMPLLPPVVDAGDLMLAAVLLFLYMETRDEDFLIMLLVVGLSMLSSEKDVS